MQKKNIAKRKKPSLPRRYFIKQSALATVGLLIGAESLAANQFPLGIQYAGLKNALQGKHHDLTILNDRPINAETPPHLLDDRLTPNELFFVRNNGIPPEQPDPEKWTLTIEGESAKSKRTYSLADLKNKFTTHSYQITLECGGNGRKEFNPPAKGNQWSTGAVGCAKWTGVRLKDLLNDVGIQEDAVYIAYYGADSHLSGDANKAPISRGVPIKKALEPESLIAWSMNDKDLPLLNGYPLRLVFGGYPASCSGKWLERIVIRNQVHDGPKMTGQAYRVPCHPVAPGTKVADEDMCIIENMPVKSLLTYPKTGAVLKLGKSLSIRGHAWAGPREVKAVDYSIDFGATWNRCELDAPANRFAWQDFKAQVQLPAKGYYEIWVRATDDQGVAQPMLLPGWNPKGYLNNACHRIAMKVV